MFVELAVEGDSFFLNSKEDQSLKEPAQPCCCFMRLLSQSKFLVGKGLLNSLSVKI